MKVIKHSFIKHLFKFDRIESLANFRTTNLSQLSYIVLLSADFLSFEYFPSDQLFHFNCDPERDKTEFFLLPSIATWNKPISNFPQLSLFFYQSAK